MKDQLFPWAELSRRLDAIAGGIAAPPHFFEDEWKLDDQAVESVKICIDPSFHFCRECGSSLRQLMLAAGLERDGERPDLQPDSWPESDGSRVCDVCGALLEYILTDFGAEQEAEHFTGHPPEVPLSREHAYELARIAETESAGDGFLRLLQGWLETHDAAGHEAA